MSTSIRQRKLKHAVDSLKPYFRKKMWNLGIIIIALNVAAALAAPLITTNDPITDLQVADDFALPSWMAYFPQYSGLPRNIEYLLMKKDWQTQVEGENKNLVSAREVTGLPVFSYSRKGTEPGGQTRISLQFLLDYPYDPPSTFSIRLPYNVTYEKLEGVKYRLVVSVLRGSDAKTYTTLDTFPPWRSIDANRWGPSASVIHSRDRSVANLAGVSILYQNLAGAVFSTTGKYSLQIDLYVSDAGDAGDAGTLNFAVGETRFRIPGKLYGVLGTNFLGADVYSQLIWGTRVSLLVGLTTASIVVAIGVLVGVTAGYKGGPIDRALTFASDTVLQLPGLPLILLAVLIFGNNIWVIILLISILSWAGLARTLRGWTLSLKQRPFVEAARAIGASDFYIMFRVIAPQTVPILAYSLVLAVPGAILTEASLSLLGLGNPFVASWGKMLNEAYFGGAVTNLTWWWLAPPVIAIVVIATGFALIGFALEETLNPRLRRR